jgi:ATP-dependent protease ClpP protease subunit
MITKKGMLDMSKISFEIPKDATRIWDICVPIVEDSENRRISAYMTGTVEEPFLYNELCYILRTAEEGTTLDLFINTPGGVVDSAFMLISAIKESKANVVGHLSGTVASAGTIIAMACDDLVVSPHLSFMIHNYSGGMSGKGHEMKARQNFTDKHLNKAFSELYKHFLTEDEMTSIIDGTDMWMNTEEVTERWNNRKERLRT